MGDGAFEGALPPVGGLGNFKGVMLCNRPSDDTAKNVQGGGEGAPPFKSMISTTHDYKKYLGLTPARTFEPTVKTRGPSAALRRHVRWLRELQDQMREERETVQQEGKEAEERKLKMKQSFEKHRDTVREMIQERDKALDEEARRQMAGERKDKTEKDKTEKKKAPPAKPLWAMTEKEKDSFEEEEAANLIDFAENLDYDKYVGDIEFRSALEALKDRTGKLQKEQDAFKDALIRDFNAGAEDDAEGSTSAGGDLEAGIEGSQLGDPSEYSCSSRKSKGRGGGQGGGEKEWDNSTACGDDRPEPDKEARDAASAVLEANPQLKAIHSKESVQKIIEKTKVKYDLVEHMSKQEPVPVPVIVASEDTQTRLHKPPDPSLLPYLYRSPAI